MKTTGLLRSGLLIISMAGGLLAQPATSFAQIEALLRDKGVFRAAAVSGPPAASGTREVRLRWERPAGRTAATQSEPAPALIADHVWSDDVPKMRSPELSASQLLVAAVDSVGMLRSWTLIADPRILRSEGPTPEGPLTGQVVEQQASEFQVSLPNDPDVRSLRIYKPVWDGTQFQLQLLAVCSLT